jgi:hypothetical protein
MDEEFKLLLEYVDHEHQLLGKVVMGLKTTWKERRAQKIDEYVKKKIQDWEVSVALHMEQITYRWHLMYHILCDVPLLHNVLPPFPWTHNK